ncbi:MAG: M15 family peptidase [Actinophytocola sp.]|nr:M15 family peptidase [Actinophytocola sp.]
MWGAVVLVAALVTACSGADASRPHDRDRPRAAPTAAAAPRVPDARGFSNWEVGAKPLPLRVDGFGRVLPTPRELRVRRLPTIDRLPPPPNDRFRSSVREIGPRIRARMGPTWQPGCPVGLRDLRYVRVSFWGFDGRPHTGEVIVHRRAAHDIVHVFARLHRARFPIEAMRIATSVDLDARPTGDGNGSGGFVCRPIRKGSTWSAHAYGLAIDINPFQNPYQRGDLVLPERASAYLNRGRMRPGMIGPGGVVVRAFADIGWSWGGQWHTPRDYMHFSATNG